MGPDAMTDVLTSRREDRERHTEVPVMMEAEMRVLCL